VTQRYTVYQRACQEDERQLEEIWVNKVMTNIDAHWDYVQNLPKVMTINSEQKKLHQSGSKNQ